MSKDCLHKISDFLEIFFNIKNLWNQSVFSTNIKFSGSTDLGNQQYLIIIMLNEKLEDSLKCYQKKFQLSSLNRTGDTARQSSGTF